MPETLTETSNFDASIVVPVGGDRRNAQSVRAAFSSLTNRTRSLKGRLDSSIDYNLSGGFAGLQNISPLTASSSGFARVYIDYHTIPGDGGGGVFVNAVDADPGTYVDDGGTVSVPSGGDGSSAWLRVLDSPVTPAMFGAYDDTGGTDMSSQVQLALDAVPIGGEVYIPGGKVYQVSGLSVTARKLYGKGQLKWKPSATESMITLYGFGPHLEGLTLNGNAANESDSAIVGITTSSSKNAILKDLYVTQWKYKCFQTDTSTATEGASAFGLLADSHFEDCNQGNAGNPVSIRSSYWHVRDCKFYNSSDGGHMIRTGCFDGASPKVVGTKITGCEFVNDDPNVVDHAGVVIETNTKDIIVSGCHFNGTRQGLKTEDLADPVETVTLVNNIFRGLTYDAANTFVCSRLVFMGNQLYDCARGATFAGESIVIGNYLDNCGEVGTGASIQATSFDAANVVIQGNYVKNAPYRGIQANDKAAIIGNIIQDATDIGIRTDGDASNVIGNIVDGCTDGIYASGTVSNTVAKLNNIKNFSGSAVSYPSLLTNNYKENRGATPQSLTATIASGVATVNPYENAWRIDTEASAATDDLNTINGGEAGQVIELRPASASRVVTAKDSTGNLRLKSDFSFVTATDTLTLIFNGTNWLELARSTPANMGERTIASGAIAISAGNVVNVDTESDASTDDLDTISGGYTGQVLTVRGTSSSRVVTAIEGGNLQLAGSASFAFTTALYTLTLIYNGTNWIELSRSAN